MLAFFIPLITQALGIAAITMLLLEYAMRSGLF